MSRKFFCVPVAAKSKIPNEHDDLGVGRGPAVLMSIGALGCLWLALVVFGWARWGSVTIDCVFVRPRRAILKQSTISGLRDSRQYRVSGGIPSRSGHRAYTVPLRTVRCNVTSGIRGRLYSVDPIFRRRDL